MDLSVSMSYVDDEKFVLTNRSGNNLLVDMYKEDEKKHLSPMELLLSALTSCAAVEIVSMIKKRRRDFKDLKASSIGYRVEKPPRYFKSIEIKYFIYSSDLTMEEAERFISLSLDKYCSVGATIRKDTIVKHDFEIIRD
jgi:putative redox protein